MVLGLDRARLRAHVCFEAMLLQKKIDTTPQPLSSPPESYKVLPENRQEGFRDCDT
jgi:hypothetical protein